MLPQENDSFEEDENDSKKNWKDGEMIGSEGLLAAASTFHLAFEAGNVESVKLLLERGAIGDVDRNICGLHIDYHGDLLTPLCCAISCKNPEAVKLLLSFGAKVNLCCGPGTGMSTPLHFAAAQEDNAECIQILLKAGASHTTRDAKGQTPLHIAASVNDAKTAVLLGAGADPNVFDSMERTPLHCAVAKGVTECVRLLLEDGRVDINGQDEHGYTALHLCAMNGNTRCTSLLLQHGSDVTIQTLSGTTALSILAKKMPDVMNRFVKRLDSSVTIHDNDVADANCELKMDFSVLISTSAGNKRASSKKKNLKKVNHGDGGGEEKPPQEQKQTGIRREMELLTCLVSTGNKKLLTHPLTEAFLLLKWRRVRKFFLASLLFQMALVALFTIYVVEVYLVQCKYQPDADYLEEASSSLSQEDEHIVSTKNIKSGPYTADSSDGGFQWFRAIPPKKKIPNRPNVFSSSDNLDTGPRSHLPPIQEETDSEELDEVEGNTTTHRSPIRSGNETSSDEEEDDEEEDDDDDDDIQECSLNLPLQVIWILLIVFTCAMGLQEIFQLVHSPSGYVVSSENWAQWLLIMTVLISSWQRRSITGKIGVFGLWPWQYPAAACGILITWSLILFQVGRFPSLGLYAEMLGKAAKNFGLIISAYACLLVAFALAFCVLFPEHPPFSSPSFAILKVFTMMIGEVDYEELVYDEEHPNLPVLFPLTAHLLLGVFILVMTIVLMNLLVGLAVSDIQGLLKVAKLNRLSRQTALIARFESFIYSKKLQAILPSSLVRIVQENSSLAGDSTHGNKCLSFYFQPNDPRDQSIPKAIQQAALNLVVSSSKSYQSTRYSFHQDGKLDSDERLNFVEAKLEQVGKDTKKILELLMASQVNVSKLVVTGGNKNETV